MFGCIVGRVHRWRTHGDALYAAVTFSAFPVRFSVSFHGGSDVREDIAKADALELPPTTARANESIFAIPLFQFPSLSAPAFPPKLPPPSSLLPSRSKVTMQQQKASQGRGGAHHPPRDASTTTSVPQSSCGRSFVLVVSRLHLGPGSVGSFFTFFGP